MKLQQLSLFLENTTGTLHAPVAALADAGVNLLSVSLADTSQFGILRLIASDPERALRVLEAAGMVVRVTEVVPVEVAHGPGGLAAALASIEEAGLAVEYMYLFGAARHPGTAVIIFRFEHPDEALAALNAAGVRVLSQEELLAAEPAGPGPAGYHG
ncbi:MAG: hypothetical protein JXA67_03235 [Micromonosporaceae bacterium]|nr:hypothetical protein [Micromonosporaceae bacterium]